MNGITCSLMPFPVDGDLWYQWTHGQSAVMETIVHNQDGRAMLLVGAPTPDQAKRNLQEWLDAQDRQFGLAGHDFVGETA